MSSRANTHVQALALIDGGLRGTPRARARSRQREPKGRGKKEGVRQSGRGEKREGQREKGEAMSAVGSKAQKNSVACHGAESTPKIHSPAPLSLTCARLPEPYKRSSRRET